MDDNQLLRYSRQIMLPQIDIAGQERLLDAHVLILGLGGLGAPVALYLAAAGVGELTLIDDDDVELSNLQRQIIHQQDSIGQAKVHSAQASLQRLNPDVRVHSHKLRLEAEHIDEWLQGIDLVIDATDNFHSRFALNHACFQHSIPLVSGAAIGFEGQIAVFDPRQADAPCYRCLYSEGDDAALNCAENGVAAPLVGVIGCMQAMEALKVLCGIGTSLAGYVLYYDGLAGQWHRMRLQRRPGCPEHPA
jgi:molybdopterin-synthase adenylyltransferase